jgi:hypothetical protein
MDSIREQFNKPVVVGIASFVVGIFIGLVVLGWWLWPVKWKDAGPEHLRKEFKEIYLRMAIDSYSLHKDPAFAQQRINEVDADAEEILKEIEKNPRRQAMEAVQTFLAVASGDPGAAVVPQPTIPGEPADQPARSRLAARTLLPFMCLMTFLLAGGIVATFLLRNRIGGLRIPAPRKPKVERSEQFIGMEDPTHEPPLSQFMTTYNIGNDLYDDSFSIDSQSGEFLGECGVGISESIGVGEPKRVTAFEVWLFDKNDIQTVTKVLMSEHAFADEAIRHRLEAKGEPIVAEPGYELILETATLQLVARVVDMSYGTGALPPESFFDRLTLELVVWPKG